MQYCSLMITFVALIMIQSQVTDATFLCDKTDTALCVRKATPADAKNPNIIRVDKGHDAMAEIVTLGHTIKQGHFTCGTVKLTGFTAATTTRYCCKLNEPHKEGEILAFSAGDLQKFSCKNRGGPPKPHHKDNHVARKQVGWPYNGM